MNIPPLPDDRIAQGYALRRETADDLAFLRHLFTAVRGPEFAAMGWPAAALAGFLANQFQLQNRHYTAAHPGADRLIVTCRGAAVGRLFLSPAPGDIRVVDIALSPPVHNAGLGTAMMRGVQEMARAKNAAVSLSVHAGSPAERLYRRLGFVAAAHSGADVEMRWTA